MKKTFLSKSLLQKSISAFSISFLGPAIIKAFFKTSSQLSQGIFTSDTKDPLLAPKQAEIPSQDSSFGIFDIMNLTISEVMIRYACFLAIMYMLEIMISLVKKRAKTSHRNPVSYLDNSNFQDSDQKVITYGQKRKTVNIVKKIFLFSLCYFICMSIFVSLCLVCNVSISSEHSPKRQETILNEIKARSLEEISFESQDQDYKTLSTNDSSEERILASSSSSLNSTFVQSIVTLKAAPLLYIMANTTGLSNGSISSMAFSNDGSTAFIAAYSSLNQSCSLLIIDVSDLSQAETDLSDISASYVTGEILFPLTSATGFSNTPYPLSIALSSDNTIICMANPSSLQIINITYPSSPTLISSYPLQSIEYLYSVALSPDDSTAFLLIDSQISGNQIVALDLTNLESPQPISVLYLSLTESYYTLYVSEQSIFLGSTDLSVWQVYNISNPASMNIQAQLDFQNFQGIQTVGFSSDYQTAYVGTSLNGYGYINLVNITGNMISNTISTTPQVPGFNLASLASIVESPDSNYLFVSGNPYLQIFDISVPTSPKVFPQTDLLEPAYMIISPNGQSMFFITETGIYNYLEMYLNYPVSQAISLQENVLGTINVLAEINAIAFSSSLDVIYVSASNNGTNNVITVDVSNPANYTILSSYNTTRIPIQIESFSDTSDEVICILSKSSDACFFEIFDASEGEYFSYYEFSCSEDSGASSDSSSSSDDTDYSDDPISFIISPYNDMAVIFTSMTEFIILNIANWTDIYLTSTTNFSSITIPTATFLEDYGILYIAGSSLYTYNMSSGIPILLGVSDLNLDGSILSLSVLPKSSLIYIVHQPSLFVVKDCYFTAMSMSSFTDFRFLATIPIMDGCYTDSSASVMLYLPPSSEAMFITLGNTLVVVDTTVPLAPVIMGTYVSPDPLLYISPIGVSLDSSTIFLATSQGVTMLNLKPDYVILFDSPRIAIGDDDLGSTLIVLAKNSQGTYDASLSNYRFADLLMYDCTALTMTGQYIQEYTGLASWLNFNQNTGVIVVSTSQLHGAIGDYGFYAAISTQVPNTTFMGIGTITTINNSIDLMVALMGLGYMDNDGYLTSSFDPDQPLLLGSEYMTYEPQIRSAMAPYYMQAWMTINVIQSLFLTRSSSSSLIIDTLSLLSINMFIELDNALFVTTGYPFSASFSLNNSQLNLIGPLSSINEALPQIIIYLNGSESCSGNVSIQDSLNPSFNQRYPNISQLFRISSQPQINISVFQSQINNLSPKTGEQFFIQFNSSTFTDVNNEPLTLTLEMQDPNSQVPDWLQMNRFTLIGNPPVQLSERDFSLKIIVSNQYQSSEIDFTLNVDLSLAYILKEIVTYGGTFIAIVGLYVYVATIYNIFAKKIYTYSKEFEIRVGEEVNAKNLYPIAFHSAAFTESRLIKKYINRKITRALKNSGIENNKLNMTAELATYFCQISSQEVDQTRLTQMIEEIANKISKEGKNQLPLYTNGNNVDKELIRKIIINEYIVKLLELPEEKMTKDTFQLIKGSLFSLVDIEEYLPSGCCTFSVNTVKLQSKLRTLNFKTVSTLSETKDGEINLSNPEKESSPSAKSIHDSKSLEKELIDLSIDTASQPRNGVNIDLLVDVMEAYAFNHHIMDADVLNVDVLAKQKMVDVWPLKSLQRFLKKDLQPLGLSAKGVIGCGLGYKFQGNVLIFSGVATHKIKDEIIVLQIVNKSGRILRELSLYGVQPESERKKLKAENKEV